MVITAAAAFSSALLRMWTTNAGFSPFFCANKIHDNAGSDGEQNQNNNYILHNEILVCHFIFPNQWFLPRAYSAFRLLSALRIR